MSGDRVGTAVVALAVIVAGGLIALRATRDGPAPDPGPPFALVDARTGQPFTEQTLFGAPAAIFFGFTHCPDVCPTSLATASRWMKALGDDADDLRVLFITVDPERDTAEKMAAYVTGFGAPIIGLTGPRAEVDRAIKRFGVIAQKVPQGESYTYDHTALLVLIDRAGQITGTVDPHDDADELAVGKLRALVGG